METQHLLNCLTAICIAAVIGLWFGNRKFDKQVGQTFNEIITNLDVCKDYFKEVNESFRRISLYEDYLKNQIDELKDQIHHLRLSDVRDLHIHHHDLEIDNLIVDFSEMKKELDDLKLYIARIHIRENEKNTEQEQ